MSCIRYTSMIDSGLRHMLYEPCPLPCTLTMHPYNGSDHVHYVYHLPVLTRNITCFYHFITHTPAHGYDMITHRMGKNKNYSQRMFGVYE